MVKISRPAWRIQRSAIFALFLRELKTRFGAYRLGYLWALLEPLGHLLIIGTVFGLRSKSVMPGIDFPVFLMSGIVPWLMFNNILSRSMSAVDANQGLFGYRQVKPIDAILARVQVEVLVSVAVMLILMVIGVLSGYRVLPADPLRLFVSYLGLLGFAIPLGVLFCVLGTLLPETKKIVPLVIKPLYFISCIFFPLHVIPQGWHFLFTWNPFVHFVELSRTYWFASFQPVITSPTYLFEVGIGLTWLGLFVYRLTRIKLVTT
ncbi:ABC transporter permease [Vogesella indigofera]|uniref:ABC transporter permease n=1 Tax=Vogesella indigofera TaxID=45465 RepID=UPI00234E6575|nr:ABC transporter permease [Vogesella indigofera]MDC7710853.1 ABC transporter permease [Vogesella indigofera]